MILIRDRESKHYFISITFNIPSPRLIDTQLRSAWSPFWQGCAVLNTEGNKLNIIVSLITDIVLLLIMLVGLLRLRSEGGGRFGIGLLLWNQVGSWTVSLPLVLAIDTY
jgi:hypothetical protein